MNDDEGWMKNDEVWRMNDERWWFQAVEGFCRRTNEQTFVIVESLSRLKIANVRYLSLIYEPSILAVEATNWDWDFMQNIFSNSSLKFWNSSFHTSKVRNSLLELGMQCWNYLLTEVGIQLQFWKSIPIYLQSQELFSGIEDDIRPLLEGKVGYWFQELGMSSNNF